MRLPSVFEVAFQAVPTAPLRIRDTLEYFRPGGAERPPWWPPDAYALALTILRDADAYARVVERWPPGTQSRADAAAWEQLVKDIGAEWRSCAGQRRRPPRPVETWWKTVLERKDLQLARVRSDDGLSAALLHLVAAADEASHSAGSWSHTRATQGSGRASRRRADPFAELALRRLYDADTLAMTIDPSRAVVLPKVHTPQRGITSRSLTHHLALHEPRDVVPRWFGFTSWLEAGAKRASTPRNALNLLLLPWPECVNPEDYRVTDGQLLNMPGSGIGPSGAYGFFTYQPARPPVSLPEVRKVLASASGRFGRIDAILFPELALGIDQCQRLSEALDVMVIGGEGAPARKGRAGKNQAVVAVPLSKMLGLRGPLSVSYRQTKHHRWCLDGSQIRTYGLGAQLDPTRDWWEHIGVERRQLHFFELADWLTFSVLICEDLARQDPVSELIRAVGPNLVVALLMDGPQLEDRWAAKYATVLAEDPGCSVLTFTSVGMARLSRPPRRSESRTVALWKDPRAPAVEIALPEGARGIVLALTREPTRERTADGREDGWTSDYIRLSGVHPVEG